MPFGGAVRTRISSQCLKRHWRTADDDYAIHNIPNAAKAIRSRNVVDRKVIQPLREGGGIDEEVLSAVEEAFNVGVYGSSGTSETGRQPLLLGLPEVEYLRDKADAICRAHANDAKAAARVGRICLAKRNAAISRPSVRRRFCPVGWRARSLVAW